MVEQILGERLDVSARIAGEQNHFDKLVIGQVVRPGRNETLAQPLAVTVIVRRVVRGLGEVQRAAATFCDGHLRRERSLESRAPAIRAGSSVSKAPTKQSIPPSIVAAVATSSHSRISACCRPPACGPSARM